MFEAGMAVEAIADATGVPHVSVIAVLAREGLWKDEVDDTGPAVRERVLRAYRGFEPIRPVLRELGITKEDFHCILLEEGEPLRKRTALTRRMALQRRRDEICSLYLAGEPIKTIVELCGINKRTIYDHLKRMEIPTNRQGPRWIEASRIQARRTHALNKLIKNRAG